MTTNTSLNGLTVFTMFAGLPEQILGWANYYINAGVDHIYVALDRPNTDLLDSLPQHDKITWFTLDTSAVEAINEVEELNVEAKQVLAFKQAAVYADFAKHSFLAFVDADELIHIDGAFLDLVKGAPDTVAAFGLSVSEMWFEEGAQPKTPFGATLAIRNTRSNSDVWRTVHGWHAGMMQNGFLGHKAGKTIYRLPLTVTHLSVHRPAKSKDGPIVVALPNETATLLHYDFGDFPSWNRKWAGRVTGDTVMVGLSVRRRAQLGLFKSQLRRPLQQQKAFFEDFSSISDAHVTLLQDRDMVRQIDVQDMITAPFKPPRSKHNPQVITPDLPSSMLQFAFVTDPFFLNPTIASILSVISNVGTKKPLRFIVLGDRIPPEDAARLTALRALSDNIYIDFFDITANLNNDVGKADQKRATFGRVYLADHFEGRRTVYLDGDILLTRSIEELFTQNFGNALLAGVTDSAAMRLMHNPTSVNEEQSRRITGIVGGADNVASYLNGGLLVYMCEHPDFQNLAEACRLIVMEEAINIKQRDQDILNHVFHGRKHILPSTYNYVVQFFQSAHCVTKELREIRYKYADASVIHFSGKSKPWMSNDSDFYSGLYRTMIGELEEEFSMSCNMPFSSNEAMLKLGQSKRDLNRALAVTNAPANGQTTERPVIEIPSLVSVSATEVMLRIPRTFVQSQSTKNLSLCGTSNGKTLFHIPWETSVSMKLDVGVDKTINVRRFFVPEGLDLSQVDGTSVELMLHNGTRAAASKAGKQHAKLNPQALGSLVGVIPLFGPDGPKRARLEGSIDQLDRNNIRGWMRDGQDWQSPLIVSIDGVPEAKIYPDRRRKSLDTDTSKAYAFSYELPERLQRLVEAGKVSVSIKAAFADYELRRSPVVISSMNDHDYDRDLKSWVSQ